MTIGIYAKASLHDINGAVENLPDLTARIETLRESLRMTGTDGTVTRSATSPLEVESEERTQVEYLQRIGPRGGTADASVLGADVREDVGVRFSPRPVFLSSCMDVAAGNSFDTWRQGGTIG